MTLEEVRALPLTALLPHQPPMLLIDRLVGCDAEHVEVELTLSPQSEFCEGGRVGAWVGLEYMAQTMAAMAGVHARLADRPPRVGLLVATREYRAQVPFFEAGQVLRVHARQVLFDPNGLSVVECTLKDANTQLELACASLTGIEVEDFQRFLQEQNR